jgi:class 3 adenylate cyclase/tetratricopeptide (TPR) repeat protein
MDMRTRRLRDNRPDAPGGDLLAFAGFTLDLAGHALRDARGREVVLTPAEFVLLETLVRNPGRALTRDQLLVEVAGRDAESYDRSVDVLVGRLRRKIERNPKAPELIVTLPRIGYKFTARPQVVAAPAPPDGAPAASGSAPAAEPVAPAAPAMPAAAPSPPVPRAARAVERRQLTIMSCEFVGLAALVARVDPEDLHAVVSAHRQCCADIIARFGGVVARFTGEGLLACFGYPQAHEHDVERAVRAGLAASEAVARLNATERGIALRTGIATGPVVVGDLSGADNAMIGEPVIFARHLRSRAAGGMVLIAPDTRRLVGGLFEYRERAPVQVEGFAAPVSAWEVIGERAAESRFSALHDAGTSFVGREFESGLLARCWSEAKAGTGRVVVITGEPGVGKSRLCAVFAERIAAEPHAASSWQCSPYHPDSPLHPVIGQLERAAGFARDDVPEQNAAKLAALVGASGTETATFLSGLLGLPTSPLPELSPQRRKQKTLDALLTHLAAVAAQAPALALFEDAHWADPTSLEFLTLLVDRVQHLPMLLLITARPGFAPPWAAESHIAALTLNRLSRADAAALVLQVADGKRLPEQMLEEILRRTDRVPLFVEELTKAVIEGGYLVEVADHYGPSGLLPLNTIPATLQDALTARLDRLEHGKEVAQVGAAIGREFSHALLAAALPDGAAAPGPALDELMRSELVFRRGAPPDAVYAFKHALVRDAAYNSIARAPRQACHARIAAAILRDEPDVAAAQPELLAHHHQEAGEYEAALRFWSRAGDLAARRSAAREAASHYRAAIVLLRQAADGQARLRPEFDLCMKLANALLQFEGFTSAKLPGLYARVRAISLELGEMDEYVGACVTETTASFVHSRYGDSLAAFAQATADRLMQTGSAVRTRADAMTGFAEYHLAHFDEAWRTIAQGIARDDADPCTEARPFFGADPAIILRAYGSLVRGYQGYFDQAAALADQAVRIAEERNRAFSLAWAIASRARSKLAQGRYAEARDVAARAVELSARHGFELREAYSLIWYGMASVALGDIKDGLPEFRDSIARAIAVGGDFALPAAIEAVESLMKAGLDQDADTFLQRGETLLRDSDVRVVEAEILRLRGKQLVAGGHTRDGEAKLRQALMVAEQQGARLFALRAATDLARVLQQAGSDREAAALLRPLHGAFTDGLDAPDLVQAAAVLATLPAR